MVPPQRCSGARYEPETVARTWASAHGPLRVSNGLPRRRRGRMEVTLGDNDRLDYVLKKFRRQITRAGLLQDMKRKRLYDSPSAQRRRQDKAAARRSVNPARLLDLHQLSRTAD